METPAIYNYPQDTTILDKCDNKTLTNIENDTEWLELGLDNFKYNYEYLFVFKSPKDHLPMMRVGKINKNKDLLIMTGPGSMLDFVNMGYVYQFKEIWFKKLPPFPQKIIKNISYN